MFRAIGGSIIQLQLWLREKAEDRKGIFSPGLLPPLPPVGPPDTSSLLSEMNKSL